MSDIYYVVLALLFLVGVGFIHVAINGRIQWPLFCVPVYWISWLIISYFNTAGLYKLSLYPFTLVILFLLCFSISSCLFLQKSKQTNDFQFRGGRAFLRRIFVGRVYNVHLVLGVFAILFLLRLILPHLSALMTGAIGRNSVYGTGEDNYIVKGTLNQFIYFRFIASFFLYGVLYFTAAMKWKFRWSSFLVPVSLVVLYSLSTLSRSNIVAFSMMFGIFYLVLLMPEGLKGIFNSIAKLGAKKVTLLLLVLVVAVLSMVAISFNRISGKGAGDAFVLLNNTIAEYGVLGYATLEAEAGNKESDFYNFRSYGTAFFGGLTSPFASVARRVGGDPLYYKFQRYELTAPNRNAFKPVGHNGRREITGNVHYSAVYAHYIDGGVLGVALAAILWGGLTGYFYGMWRFKNNVFAMLICTVFIYAVLKSCHVAQMTYEAIWFALVIYYIYYAKSRRV